MRNIVILLILFLAAGYALLNFHFILLDDSMKIIKKTGVRYEHTFVDARGAKKLELLTQPDLIKAGFNDVVRQVEGSVKQSTK